MFSLLHNSFEQWSMNKFYQTQFSDSCYSMKMLWKKTMYWIFELYHCLHWKAISLSLGVLMPHKLSNHRWMSSHTHLFSIWLSIAERWNELISREQWELGDERLFLSHQFFFCCTQFTFRFTKSVKFTPWDQKRKVIYLIFTGFKYPIHFDGIKVSGLIQMSYFKASARTYVPQNVLVYVPKVFFTE